MISVTASSSRPRVLFLDDEVLIREVTARILRNLGCDVTAVGDAESAVNAAQASLAEGRFFDLLIIDLNLPSSNGVRVRDRILQLGITAPAVLATGYSDEQVTSHYPDFGFAGLLLKPYSLEDMQTVMKSLGIVFPSHD
jgi:two-component system, cell cycle sensor histidine kinase and response regulator CckA